MSSRPVYFKERAEDYTFEELNHMSTLTSDVEKIGDYLRSPMYIGRPLMVVGDKGSGKTFAVIKALMEHIHRSKEFVPLMLMFKQKNEIKPLDPLVLGPQEVWGERLKKMNMENIVEFLQLADAIVLDDIHYICEAITAGEYPPRRFVDFLESVLKQVKKKKKVVLLAADQLSYYSPVIGIKRFDKLLPRFGLYTKDWDEDHKVDILAVMYMSPPGLNQWERLFSELGVSANPLVKLFTFRCTHNPRALIRFINAFQGEITLSRFIGEIMARQPRFKPVTLLKISHACERNFPTGAYSMLRYLKGEDIISEFQGRIGKLKRLQREIEKLSGSAELPEKLNTALFRLSIKFPWYSYHADEMKEIIGSYMDDPKKYYDLLSSLKKAYAEVKRVCASGFRKEGSKIKIDHIIAELATYKSSRDHEKIKGLLKDPVIRYILVKHRYGLRYSFEKWSDLIHQERLSLRRKLLEREAKKYFSIVFGFTNFTLSEEIEKLYRAGQRAFYQELYGI